ncbi:glycosyltransferase family 2 protein [Flavisolibacter sp. BT320]|nr:glycosyltransferase family 2 protein [Flavisolibacter longurius]
MMVTISILIPIHNRLQVTKQGILALQQSINNFSHICEKNYVIKTIVIDDGSTDGSAAWIKQNYPDIQILTGDGNLWWSGAINLGAKFAIEELKSQYLLLWNDDIIPDQNYFIKINNLIKSEEMQKSIIGSQILVHNNEMNIWSIGGYFNKYTGRMGMNTKFNGEVTRFLECDWQPGMGTIIPVKIFRDASLWWDEKHFPQYHGDADFVLRFKRKGIRVLTCLDLVIYNKVELTGLVSKNTFAELYKGLTSIRSFHNFRKDFCFYIKHGIVPFAFWGMIKKYFFYIGGFIKHSVIK